MGEKKVDKYQFNNKDTLGAGAFGTVFRAVDTTNRKTYALKMISKSKVLNDDYAKEGLLSEIRIMKRLQSPNIVQLVDVLETSNNYYIIQELCDQGDLAKFLKQQGYCQQHVGIKIMTDILRGFIELIKHGVIHRDLKPANILISNGSFKLADFGFAKAVDNFAKQMFFSSVGTPLYMSPQILRSERYTTKSDIWSFGFIFYEILYGKTPWIAASIPQLVNNINSIPLTFDDRKNQISEEVKDVLRKCLIPDENNRIAWIDLYKHPVFRDSFQDFQDISSICEVLKYLFQSKAVFIVSRMRTMVEVNQIELEDLFQQFDFKQRKQLDMQNIKSLLQMIDPDIQRMEIEYIFNSIDKDSNGNIDFSEFRQWLLENEVRLSIRQTSNTITLPFKNTQNFPQQYQPQSPVAQSPLVRRDSGQEYEAALAIIKLRTAIQKYNINLRELFEKYDKDKDGQIKLEEYGSMLRKIDPTINEQATLLSFKLFDNNSQNFIHFSNFKDILEKFEMN